MIYYSVSSPSIYALSIALYNFSLLTLRRKLNKILGIFTRNSENFNEVYLFISLMHNNCLNGIFDVYLI